MQLSSPQQFRCPRLRATLRVLPLLLLNGALMPVAHAQSTGAQTATPSVLSSLFQNLFTFAFFALLVGAVRPKTFTFLFKEKTSRKRVCGIFGAAMVGFAMVGSAFEPKPVAPVVTAQERRARSDLAKAQSQARAAEQRAKAAEARAGKAEKAQADKVARQKQAERDRVAAARVEAQAEEIQKLSPTIQELPSQELPSNVAEVNVPGVGKRQVGVVDNVEYAVLSVEKVPSIGRTRADGVFYLLRVVASNTAKKAHSVSTVRMKMVDDQEREFSASGAGNTELLMQGDQGAQFLTAKLQPGVVKKFTLVFDAPDDASGLALKIPAGTFSFGSDAVIKMPDAD